MKLEVVNLPVSDVDRAKRFYQKLGWRLDGDFAVGEDFRAVQLTSPNSQCAITFGKGHHRDPGLSSRSDAHRPRTGLRGPPGVSQRAVCRAAA